MIYRLFFEAAGEPANMGFTPPMQFPRCKTRGEYEMKINCISCGHKVDLDDAYDDYEGQVKCFACGTLLEIRTEQGNIKSVVIVRTVHGFSEGDNLST
jgi:transcription elongation factor Elf1